MSPPGSRGRVRSRPRQGGGQHRGPSRTRSWSA
jgi:hypothetical protein